MNHEELSSDQLLRMGMTSHDIDQASHVRTSCIHGWQKTLDHFFHRQESDEDVSNSSTYSSSSHNNSSARTEITIGIPYFSAMTVFLLRPEVRYMRINWLFIVLLTISFHVVGANSISKQTRSFILDCKPLKDETWDGLIEFIEGSSGFADVCPFTITGPEACPPPPLPDLRSPSEEEGYVVTSDTDLYLSCDPYQLSSDSKCIIDCPSLGRHFTVNTGGSLTLENFVLRHATNTSIWVEQGGRLSVFGSVFEDNNSKNNEENGVGGGAIFSGPNAFIEVRYTDFRNNQVGTGGAIFIHGDDDNSGEEGSSTVRLVDCAFSNNIALNAGGAVAVASTGSGSSKLIVDSCTFANNEADNGGAIYVADSLSSYLSVSYSHFSTNLALNGGAIDYSNGSTDISDCTFTRNYAFNWGGALNAGDGSSSTIRRNVFSGNGAQNNGPAINDRDRSEIVVRDNSGCGNAVDQGRECDGVLIWLSPRRLLCRSFAYECTLSPTSQPSVSPSDSPSISVGPSGSPSESPSGSFFPSSAPTHSPSLSTAPSTDPSESPSESFFPSDAPTNGPTLSTAPSTGPSLIPSDTPSLVPSSGPTSELSDHPSLTATPSIEPSLTSSSSPSTEPSAIVSDEPTIEPSLSPSSREVGETDPNSVTGLEDGSPNIGSSSTNSQIPNDLPSLETQSSPKSNSQRLTISCSESNIK